MAISSMNSTARRPTHEDGVPTGPRDRIFFAIVTPIYWFVSYEIIGTVALLLTTLTLGMIGGYVGLVGHQSSIC